MNRAVFGKSVRFSLTVNGGGLLALPSLLGAAVLVALIGRPRKRDASEVAA